jgi:hypothetical protein
MKVFFGGSEKGSYRRMLLDNGVKHYALNLTHLPIPKKKEFVLSDIFQGNEVVIYTSENDEDLARFDDFVRNHADEISIVIGRPDYDGAWLGDKYVPVWNDETDLERLAWLCQKYGRVAVSDKAVTPRNMVRIRQLAARWGAKLIGITSKPDLIEHLPWDAVIVNSWTSVIRYGETQVWDGHGLRRYPAQQKESSRKKHRADIIRLDVDIDSVMEDDVAAIGTLAIRSWQQWETHTFGAYDPSVADDEDEFQPPSDPQIITIGGVTPTSQNVAPGGSSITTGPPNERHERGRSLLPVMGVESVMSLGHRTVGNDGEELEIEPETVSLLKYNADPLRECNNCYLAPRCPQFHENATCAFSLPLEIKSKDQLQAAMKALLEMQVGRVMFARFAEELEGQGLDSNLSVEIDRVFNLVEKMARISDNREMLRIEVETRGSSGVLSRLFGQKAGETNRMLPNGGLSEDATDALYADVIDFSEDEA